MKPTPAILCLSTLLNVAVVGVFILRPTLAPAAFREAFRIGDRAVEAGPTKAKATARPGTPAKLWPMLETKDLSAWVARLRAAGFPAAVIREMVQAEVNARYAARLRAFTEPDPNTPFWKLGAAGFGFDAAKAADYATLQRERARILREVFSDPFFAGDEAGGSQRRQFGNLPRQKIELLQRIEDDYADMNAAIRAGAHGVILPEDREKLALLAREKRADLAGVLNAEEIADYEMRSSPITKLLSTMLGEFHATETEYRAIFEQQRALNERFPSDNGAMGNYRERRTAQQELEIQLRATLGEARYNDYARETSDAYQQLRRQVERENLPVEAGIRAFDLRNSVAQESLRIVGDAALSNEQKRAALTALAQTTRNEVTGLLGPTVGPAFVKTLDASWLGYLEQGSAVTFTGAPNSSLGSDNVTISIGNSAMPVRSLPPVSAGPRQ